MTENLDDHEPAEPADTERPVKAGGADALFGDFAVLSPGVEIVLDGRPISASPR